MSEQKKINVLRGRKLNLENAHLIGTGACSKVYMLDDGIVVKVLFSTDFKDAEREIQLSKWAFSQGIPTAISYDVADVDGHPGLVYESLGRGNLRNELRDNPDKFDEIMKKYLPLIHKINSTEVEENQLPSAKKVFIDNHLSNVKDILSPEEYKKASLLVNTIPENMNLIHGDCHIKNVKVYNGQLFLIDFDSLSYGNKIFELMGLYCCYKAYHELNPSDFDSFFEIKHSTLSDILNCILDDCFANMDKDEKQKSIDKVAFLTYIYMISCVKKDTPDDIDSINLMYNKSKEYINKLDDLII